MRFTMHLTMMILALTCLTARGQFIGQLGGGDKPQPGGNAAGNTPAAGNVPAGPAVGPGSVQVVDAGMQMATHTVDLPAGWSADVRIVWRPHANFFASPEMTLTAPAGVSAHVLTSRPYTFTNHMETVQQFNLRPGKETLNGSTFLMPPDSPGGHVTRDILPDHRPQAQNVRVVSQKQLPELKKVWEDLLGPTMRDFNQLAQQLREGGYNANMWLTADEARIRYTEGGQEFEESFLIVMAHTRMDFNGMGIMPPMMSYDWSRLQCYAIRAPAGRLDAAMPQAATVLASIRSTPQWSAINIEMQNRSGQLSLENARKMAQQREELAKMHAQTVKNREQSNDKIHQAFISSIHQGGF
ncbi:MAG: hypothetical protein ACFCVE_09245 [Phycisphaerae bacterium]